LRSFVFTWLHRKMPGQYVKIGRGRSLPLIFTLKFLIPCYITDSRSSFIHKSELFVFFCQFSSEISLEQVKVWFSMIQVLAKCLQLYVRTPEERQTQ
jgi:hypothetical protein